MPEPVTTSFIIWPAVAAGLVIGLYEAIALMKDVQANQGKFGHATHALVFALLFTFACFNVEFVLGLIPQIKTIPFLSNPLVFRIAIGLIAAIKIHAVSRATKSVAGVSGLSETWIHTFVVGGLIVAAPYVWPLFSPMLPEFLRIKAAVAK